MSQRTYVTSTALQYRFDDAASPIFDDVNVSIHQGLTAVVGLNGSGKSVLAELLAGRLTPTQGQVMISGTVGYIPQSVVVEQMSVAEVLGFSQLLNARERIERGQGSDQDFSLLDGRWDFEAKTERLLSDFGFCEDVMMRSMPQLSGGEQTKIRLMGLSLHAYDIIVLDEPSNHLDGDARVQLLHWLKNQPCAIVISHDRQLLAQADEIIEVEHGRVTHIRSGFDTYLETKRQQQAQLTHQEHHQERELKQAQKKHRQLQERQAKQQKQGQRARANANQSKIILDRSKETHQRTQASNLNASQQALEQSKQRLGDTKKQKTDAEPLHFNFSAVEARGGVALQLIDVVLPHGASEPVNLLVQRGQKWAISGANGVGKSTLLQLVARLQEPVSGEIIYPSSVKYLDQHFSMLDRHQSALANIQRLCPGFSESEYRTLLAQVRLRKDKALYPIEKLSGGECLKVAMACLFYGKERDNILLLDEPDNHLDLDSKMQLEQALNDYPGTFLLVSHDARFIENSGVDERLCLT